MNPQFLSQATALKKNALALTICCLSAISFAQKDTPQQSTTGPTPPKGVAPKSEDLEKNSKSTIIDGVPGYSWRHGCGPTALGMVIGYYDTHGFDHLISGDASTQTVSVNQTIASEGSGTTASGSQYHYEDYALPLDYSNVNANPLTDRSESDPDNCHDDNCIADWMQTSMSREGNYYGWSWSNMINPAYTNFVHSRGNNDIYQSTQYQMGTTLTWDLLKEEIYANRPMVFLVDTDGNGGTDHFVTIVGFNDEGGKQEYGCLDTWAPVSTIRWCDFKQMSAGTPWGIWGGWSFIIQHRLTVLTNGHGTVNQLPADQIGFDHDKPVLLLAVPDEGYEFTEWSGNVAAEFIHSNPIVLTMDANKTAKASFQEIQPVNSDTWLFD